MVFEKGISGNPAGKPKGAISVRNLPVHIIYKVFKKYGAEKFEQELTKLAKEKPIGYYLKFIRPIQPNIMDMFKTDDDATSLEITIKKTYEEHMKPKAIEAQEIKITRTPEKDDTI